ncbi:MFS transporter [Cordyceps militaris CM01]|uniref:MFS transporter n=1 Tax=Cordyceps militaris (strain CM01) TaxID=983644 RepID=G3JGU0_CORMM|nr:MFS transporter [Cordyceps militaris CM01]EGX92454.1 MFS transporter [Cordyceps militaris CM01]
MTSDSSNNASKAEEAHGTHAHVQEFGHGKNLSAAHSKFLMERYGTVDLEPLPDPTLADPLNWPQSKKLINLALVSFHTGICSFTASSVIPAFGDIATRLGVTIQAASYMTSLQIVIFGGAPFLWNPLARRYGRLPIFVLSLFGSVACNIGCARSRTYGELAACRALGAFFISPAAALGSGTVQEMFFAGERARYMGIWTLMFTFGVPFAPFLFGFAVERAGYEWIFWTLAITNVVQFVGYMALGSETIYIRGNGDAATPVPRRLALRRIDPAPFSALEFVYPFVYAARWRVAIPAIAYAMVFLLCNVVTSVEIPQLFAENFHFGAQALGLQFLALIVGSLAGEGLASVASSWWMAPRGPDNERPPPERRLWLSHVGYSWCLAGIVVFLVLSAQLSVYNVSPVIGAGIAAAGNQVVTTVMVNYAVDCYPEDAASVGVFVAFVRQTLGFIGPFWFPQLFAATGAVSAAVAVGLLIAVSIVPTIVLQVASRKYSLKPREDGS